MSTKRDIEALVQAEQPYCRVQGGDYTYFGWVVCVFTKRSGASRCVVEDANGRLFIHRMEQVDFNTGEDK